MNITSLMTKDTYFSTFYICLLHHLSFFVQGMQHTIELAWPLLYHGDANANIFIKTNSFLFFTESPITNAYIRGVCPSIRL